jgi:hypothetical protein
MKTKFNNLFNSVIVLVAFGIMAFANLTPDENLTKPTKVKKEKTVVPPLKGVDIPYEIFTIDAKQGSTLTYKTGSKIIIPQNAFVNQNGITVSGEITIKYREFHTPSDFFVSGIPMTYDSAGVQYHFESAGMLEFLAFQNDSPVFANPNSKVVIQMSSKQIDDKYNIYAFDSITGNWRYVYKDKAKIIKLDTPSVKQYIPIASTEPETKLIEPQKANGNKFHFDINADKKEFPDLAVYEGVEFEATDGLLDINYTQFTWNDAQLIKKENTDCYLLAISRGTNSFTFEVRPVYSGQAYDNAYEKYLQLSEERKKRNTAIQRKNDSLLKMYSKERIAQADLAENLLKNSMASLTTQFLIQRTFILDGFGIWNSDCPAVLPKGAEFAANYVDSTGKKLVFKTLYLVEKGRNAMFAITSYSRLYYNPQKENMLWAVTNENKIALFKEKDFKKLKIEKDQGTVVMKVIDKKITKAYEVKELLDI